MGNLVPSLGCEEGRGVVELDFGRQLKALPTQRVQVGTERKPPFGWFTLLSKVTPPGLLGLNAVAIPLHLAEPFGSLALKATSSLHSRRQDS